MLSDLSGRLKGEAKVPLHFIIAPGNHDCDFRGDQGTRELVVSDILRKADNLGDSYLATTTKVQKEFFAFRRSIHTASAVDEVDPLWSTYNFSIDDFKFAFDVLNASWISTRHEQQGGLLFPYERYRELNGSGANLRLCVLHHPFNWYSQSNYRNLRGFIHRRCDFILTGHEHSATFRDTEDSADGSCIYIEGDALQTNNPSYSAFNVLLVDIESKKFRCETLRLESSHYEPSKEASWELFRPLVKKEVASLSFASSFLSTLRDPGATLKHPSGRDLILEDFFIYPDVEDRSDHSSNAEKAKSPKLNSSMLERAERLKSDCLLQGDDEAGKTRLLYRLAVAYREQGFVPIFVKGDRLKSATAAAIDSEIASAVRAQYNESHTVEVAQVAKDKKILLIDDFDKCPLNAERRSLLLAELRERFGRLLLTVGEHFEMRELLGGSDDLIALAAMRHYRILPLNGARRLELIRKWNRIGIAETASENHFLKVCDDAEKLIESTKLRFVASTSPIFVLSLLQATASGIASEMHNTSFAHYYHFLIVGALEKAKVVRSELNTVIAACTHLSWFIKKNGTSQRISLSQYGEFVGQYSRNWTSTDPQALLDVLLASKLLELDGDTLGFTYPYSYYYFLGKYTSIAQTDNDVQEYIGYCLKHLYARECANALLFLAHHSANSNVLNAVVTAINGYFNERKPATLDSEDIKAIRALLSQAPAIRYKQKVTPERYRERQAQANDSRVSGDGLVDQPRTDADGKRLFHDLVGLTKAIEIAGTLLTHQFANYSRSTKTDAIKAMFDGAMRTVKEIHFHFEDIEQLVNSVVKQFKDKNDGAQGYEIEMKLRNAVAHLLKIVTFSLVVTASSSLRAKDLEDNIDMVVKSDPTCANRLIKLSQELQIPGRLPKMEIDRLRSAEASNPAVMGVLQLMILNRLYMFHTDRDEKDWAMTVFGLGTGTRHGIELKQTPVVPKKIDR